MITYYSDIISLKSINNPLIDNGTEMRYSGFFSEVNNSLTPHFGISLEKTLHNQGRIYCNDSSKLFSISAGYVGLIMSFPYNLKKGVIDKVRFSDKEYMLWAVNYGESDIEAAGIGVLLTQNGIEFKVKTSAGNYALVDNETTIPSGESFEIEFFWDKDGIDIENAPTMLIRVNGKDISYGVMPIIDDLDVNSEFYTAISQSEPSGNVFDDIIFQIFDNQYKQNNIACSISRIIIGDSTPIHFN